MTNRILSVGIVASFLLAGSARAEIIYGMTAAGSGGGNPGIGLVRFDSANPSAITNIGNFSGVVSGHSVRSIDFRPANGQLYAISLDATGANGQLYTVNLTTAALTAIGTGFSLGTNASVVAEIDFNPVVDRIRMVTAATGASGQNNNFRLHPDTGALVATDTNLAYASGDPQFGFTNFNMVGAAYTNNFPGAGQTSLYSWDYQTDSLVLIGGLNGTPSPNGGQMFTVNTPASFLTTNAGIGMDISGFTNILYITHDDPNNAAIMGLYTRDLTTGAQNFLGAYGAGVFIVDISVVPEPGSLALCGLGAAGLVRIVRRRR